MLVGDVRNRNYWVDLRIGANNIPHLADQLSDRLVFCVDQESGDVLITGPQSDVGDFADAAIVAKGTTL